MFVSYNHESVMLTGRWAKLKDKAVSTACGSKIEISYYGKMLVLQFDMQYSHRPYPHIWIQADDGAFIETELNKYIRICSETNALHKVTVIFKSAVEMYHRWYEPLDAKVSFLGYEAEKPGKVQKRDKKYIEFLGDSITEGILIDEDYKIVTDFDMMNRPFQDDVTASYAYLTAKALNLEPIIMGYGGIGVTNGGSGSVPKAAEAFPFCYAANENKMPDPEYVVINYGANDRSMGKDAYLNEYSKLLDLIRTAHPTAKVFVLGAFCGWCSEELTGFISEYNSKNNCTVLYINSAGWLPKEPLHPNRSGHIIAAQHLTEELKKLI